MQRPPRAASPYGRIQQQPQRSAVVQSAGGLCLLLFLGAGLLAAAATVGVGSGQGASPIPRRVLQACGQEWAASQGWPAEAEGCAPLPPPATLNARPRCAQEANSTAPAASRNLADMDYFVKVDPSTRQFSVNCKRFLVSGWNQ